MSESSVRPVVVTAARGSLRAKIEAGGHVVIADEPRTLGGGDTGPTPYDLIAGALGACTAITVQMYAELKQWPLEQVTVSLVHGRVHADDCRDEKFVGKITRIEKTLTLVGPSLTEEQRARLAEIAERCPVERTLEGEIVVTTVLK